MNASPSDLEGKYVQTPDTRKAIEYLGYTKIWEESCTREIEKFGGDTVLINEERIKKADRYLKKWIDMAERLLSRHPSSNSGDTAEQQALRDLFDVRRFLMENSQEGFFSFLEYLFFTFTISYSNDRRKWSGSSDYLF